jgi:predicted Zn-dependent protease
MSARFTHIIAVAVFAISSPFYKSFAQSLQLPTDYGIDIQLGLAARSRMMEGSGEILDTSMNSLGSEVWKNLLLSSGYGGETFPWRLTLVNNSVVNAAANPGGQVYVYGGLIKLIEQNKGLWAATLW